MTEMEKNGEVQGFPDGSSSKESTCDGGDTEDVGSIPGLGRFPEEGNVAYLLRYSCLEILWTEDSGQLQSIGLQRIGHN